MKSTDNTLLIKYPYSTISAFFVNTQLVVEDSAVKHLLGLIPEDVLVRLLADIKALYSPSYSTYTEHDCKKLQFYLYLVLRAIASNKSIVSRPIALYPDESIPTFYIRTDFQNTLRAILDFVTQSVVGEPPILPSDEGYGICNLDSGSMKTQKAKGIVTLYEYRHGTSTTISRSVGYELLETTSVYPYNKDLSKYKHLFVRPCPTRPRHGFVDSRVVQGIYQFNNVVMAAKSVDPQAEFICMELANGNNSALLTPDLLTLSNARTGCTGNAHNGIKIVLPFDTHQYISDSMKLCAEVTYPYIEMVEHNRTLNVVQLRDGPPIKGVVNDYIPRKVIVENMITCHDDLMIFESQIMNCDPNSTIVYAHGVPITSHYGAHAMKNGIAFINKMKVYQGMVLEPTVDDKPKKYTMLRNLICRLMKEPLIAMFPITPAPGRHQSQQMRGLAKVGVLGGHGSVVWDVENVHTCNIIAHSLLSFIGTYATSLYGELRYYRSRAEDSPYENKRVTQCGAINTNLRSEVYTKLLYIPVNKVIRNLAAIEADFLAPIWSESYGGGNWARSAWSMHELIKELTYFLNNPCQASWNAVLGQWHRCINEEHNGGRILSKFMPEEVFDLAADTPAILALDNECYPLLLAIGEKTQYEQGD